MTPEELKYFKALQPFFKDRMGRWKDGDAYIFKIGDAHSMVEFNIFKDDASCTASMRINQGFEIYWLPRTIDTEQPERGLWGMMNWNKYGQGYEIDAAGRVYQGNGIWTTPTLTILKALAAQEGVKV